jgi:hypothetical protein
MNYDGLQWMWKKWVVLILRYYSGIYLERRRKTTKNSVSRNYNPKLCIVIFIIIFLEWN